MEHKRLGIVAEFDPFHRGHAYLMAQAKALAPEAPVVVAMSGHFTQRGCPAALSPHVRAEMALRGGADLVLELPLVWSVSSAQGFARGGVEVLSAAGVDTLVCGSESGRIDLLQGAADCLQREDFPQVLKQHLSSGISFAAARQKAVWALAGEGAGALLSQPNDLLAVSYLEAIKVNRTEMSAYAVRRTGPGHNAAQTQGQLASASAIRSLLEQGDFPAAASLMPEEAQPLLLHALESGTAPASLKQCQRAVLYRLCQMSPLDFAALPDCSEGLEHRLYRAAQQACSLEDFHELARSKRYPLARIRRLTLWAFLGIEKEDIPENVPYLRVLAMKERGQQVLHELRKTCPLPVITKPAAGKKLTGGARQQLELSSRAADLWQLCLPQAGPRGSFWRENPVIMR